MNNLPKVSRQVMVGGVMMTVMVSLCPPRHAAGVLPLHIDPIGVAEALHEKNLRGGPCEDDCEVSTGDSILDPIAAEAEHRPEGFGTAEIMGFASEPSRSRSHRESDNTFGNAMFESSVVASLCDADRRRRG